MKMESNGGLRAVKSSWPKHSIGGATPTQRPNLVDTALPLCRIYKIRDGSNSDLSRLGLELINVKFSPRNLLLKDRQVFAILLNHLWNISGHSFSGKQFIPHYSSCRSVFYVRNGRFFDLRDVMVRERRIRL
jgi:hypothetical protein